MIPLHLPEVRRVLEQVGLRNKARAESYLKKELLKLGIHEPDDIEPLADIIAGQVRQALRRRQQDKSIYTKRDLGLKVRKVIDEPYDKIPMDAEINRAIEKVGSRVEYTKKEQKARKILLTFCSAGYYGYLRLRELLGIPLEHPTLRPWYAKFLPVIPNLVNPGGEVKLLEGTYNISTTINILKNYVTLSGVGFATKLFLINGANCDVIQIGDGATALECITIRDLQINGNKANQTTGNGIYIYGATTSKILDSTIRNVLIDSAKSSNIVTDHVEYSLIHGNYILNAGSRGMFIQNTDTAKSILISDNHIRGSGAGGIYLIGATNAAVVGNYMSYNGTYGIYTSATSSMLSNFIGADFYAIYLSGGDHYTIVGNRLVDFATIGIYMYTYHGRHIITGNRLTGGGVGDIGIYNVRDGTIITGNLIEMMMREGITVAEGNVTISGNVFFRIGMEADNTYDAIKLGGANRCSIVGNSIWTDLTTRPRNGIYLYSSSYNTIMGNVITACSSYGINISDVASNENFIGKNYLTGNTLGAINDAGTGTILGVVDTVNNIDNVT